MTLPYGLGEPLGREHLDGGAHGGFNVLDALDRLDGLEILDILGGEFV